MENFGTVRPRKPWLAVLLSFASTGLGQVYNGQWRKGLTFFGIETVLGIPVVYGLGSFSVLVGGVTVLLVFNLGVAVEAYCTARNQGAYRLGRTNIWWVYALFFIANLVVGLGLDGVADRYYYKSFKVPSKSMLYTLEVGDHFMAEVLSREAVVVRGDIVVFLDPESGRHFVKRVIGLPGETLEVRDRMVFINGRALDEPYALHTQSAIKSVRDIFGPVTLESGEYFVMGDNREASFDSRWFGPVPGERIMARARYIYFPGHLGSAGWFGRLGMDIR